MCRACLAQYECALHRAHEARARNGWRCVCRTWFAQVELAHHAYMIAPLYGVPAWLAPLLLIQKYTYRQSSCAGLTQLAQKNKTACDMKHFCSLVSSNAKAPIEGPYAYKQRLHGSHNCMLVRCVRRAAQLAQEVACAGRSSRTHSRCLSSIIRSVTSSRAHKPLHPVEGPRKRRPPGSYTHNCRLCQIEEQNTSPPEC